MALCSESTGTIWPGRASALTSGPPMMSDSLFARARVVPAPSAARVGSSPIAPVIPLTTTSAGRAANAEPASGQSTARGRECRHTEAPPRVSPKPAWLGSCDADALAPDRRGQLVIGGVRCCDDRDLEGHGLLREERDVAPCGQAHHLEAVGVAPDEVEGLVPMEPVEPSRMTLRRRRCEGGAAADGAADGSETG